MAILGVIADDFTGATDIAGMLVKNGMRTIQTIGVPTKGTIPDDVDAVVVALKTRSIPAKEAVSQSLDALKALQAAGCVRFFFKYCSTFDSTDAGNIGPVGDALLDALKAKQAIYCPAFPENNRTIFFGHLFVGDVLLSDSHMRHHPLTPMTDASLVRVLARQTKHKVGLTPLKQVQSGSASLRAALDKLAADGVRHVVVDAVADTDLGIIGEAIGDDVLVTGGSGVALGLPAAYRRRGLLTHKAGADALPKVAGAAAVLAGSCSAATLGQIAAFKGAHSRARHRRDLPRRGCRRQGAGLGQGQARQRTDPALGQRQARSREGTASQVRHREIESRRSKRPWRRWHAVSSRPASVGWSSRAARPRAPSSAPSTSRRCASAPRSIPACPGPPRSPKPMLLALKSGNFGAPDFFTKAFERL